MSKAVSLLIPALLLAGAPLLGDTIVLTSGNSYTGHLVGERSSTLGFQGNGAIEYHFPYRDLQSLSFGPAGETVNLRSGKTYFGRLTGPEQNNIRFIDDQGISYDLPVSQVSTGVFNEAWNGPYEATGRGLVLPVGTEISVMSNLAIDSRHSHPGETFPASITQDVVGPQGNIVIPRYSDAKLLLRKESTGGVHSGHIMLDLDSVKINGVWHYVASTNVVESNGQGVGKNRRTGEFLGGGAALGALLGAIAGGGKGAGIGAAAGAGGGLLGEIFTHGRHVHVPAETTLTFELNSPLVLRPNR